ncbi:MAG: hypothetical protein OXB88_02340 [Bacteriovoracales bacterium]|nr:hypothetical protein [Bacteriovoracales bacterium]
MRINNASRDSFKEESLLRYSDERLKNIQEVSLKNLADCHLGSEEEGLKSLRSKISSRKESPDYWNQVGLCYFLNGKKKKSIFYFNMAIKKSKKRPYSPALNNKGVVFLHLGHERQALGLFRKAEKGNKSLKVPLFNMAQVYLRFHLLAPAKKILIDLHRKNPRDTHVIYSLASLHLAENQDEKAHELFQSVPSDDLKFPHIALLRSMLFYRKGEYKKAISTIDDSSTKWSTPFNSNLSTLKRVAKDRIEKEKKMEKRRKQIEEQIVKNKTKQKQAEQDTATAPQGDQARSIAEETSDSKNEPKKSGGNKKEVQEKI